MPTQFATFVLDELHFAVAVPHVQEVTGSQPMTRVPLAPPVVAGLINLRGHIVTALDLRTRIGLPPRLAGQLPSHVIVRSNDGVLSLLVDEIGAVVEVADDQFERVPATVDASTADLLRGVCHVEGRLLLVLDVERAVWVEGDRSTRDGTRRSAARE